MRAEAVQIAAINWRDPVRAVEAEPARPLALAVIVPTLNEAGNVAALVAGLDRALAGIEWEAIFVDDNSRDGTAALVRAIGRTDRRVRVIQRIGRRGLSSAVVEGALATAAPVVAVIDGDMQHDEAMLPALHAAVSGTDGGPGCDLAVGSRYADGGAADGFSETRSLLSRLATRLARSSLGIDVADPMSGFFAARHDVILAITPRLSNVGFKILMDLLASSPRPLAVREISYRFRERTAGNSKLDGRVVQEFFILLLEKLFGRYFPARFLMFALVGSLGLCVNLGTIGFAMLLGSTFVVAQTLGVFVSMTFNYVLNNAITYRDIRLKGGAFVRGLLSYYGVCLIGALGNIGVGTFVYGVDQDWAVAGIAGALVAVVWNYAASSLVTWRSR